MGWRPCGVLLPPSLPPTYCPSSSRLQPSQNSRQDSTSLPHSLTHKERKKESNKQTGSWFSATNTTTTMLVYDDDDDGWEEWALSVPVVLSRPWHPLHSSSPTPYSPVDVLHSPFLPYLL
ncbi:hypothetical protein KC19_1G221700 [Ceratodon purpureus]|uniref:Uncharacterized protein n=1 Tax=Ceratodon purpureus TaxID=3225 RepID=A0A8T0J829_CERPU|nr:hypothetical protein KC19_1G221700 [Ceratodon purpureus]